MVVHNPILIPKTENLLRLESQKTLAIGKHNIAASGLNSLREKLNKNTIRKSCYTCQEKSTLSVKRICHEKWLAVAAGDVLIHF